jgi:hypothetical protein
VLVTSIGTGRRRPSAKSSVIGLPAYGGSDERRNQRESRAGHTKVGPSIEEDSRIASQTTCAGATRLPPQLPPQEAPNEPRTAASADQTALETGNLTVPTLPPEQKVQALNRFSPHRLIPGSRRRRNVTAQIRGPSVGLETLEPVIRSFRTVASVSHMAPYLRGDTMVTLGRF